MVQFTPKGTYEEAILYIDTIVAAVDQVEARHPGFIVDSLGVSTDKALDAEIQGGLAKAGLDLDPADDPHPDGRARARWSRR